MVNWVVVDIHNKFPQVEIRRHFLSLIRRLKQATHSVVLLVEGLRIAREQIAKLAADPNLDVLFDFRCGTVGANQSF